MSITYRRCCWLLLLLSLAVLVAADTTTTAPCEMESLDLKRIKEEEQVMGVEWKLFHMLTGGIFDRLATSTKQISKPVNKQLPILSPVPVSKPIPSPPPFSSPPPPPPSPPPPTPPPRSVNLSQLLHNVSTAATTTIELPSPPPPPPTLPLPPVVVAVAEPIQNNTVEPEHNTPLWIVWVGGLLTALFITLMYIWRDHSDRDPFE